jgi:hypothetical protein
MTLREKIARVIAADFARQEGVDAELPDDLSWDYVDQGRVDFGEVADAVIAALKESQAAEIEKLKRDHAAAVKEANIAKARLKGVEKQWHADRAALEQSK